MAKIKGLKLDKQEVSQTINLKDITGVDLDPTTTQEIGQALIDKMVDRTRDGKDVDGKSFKNKYKDTYVDTDEFKAYGKSKNDVNMTLTGGMLADITVIEANDQELIIGHEDETETAKSFNHNTGDRVPTRAFFGVTDSDIDEVLESFQTEIEAAEVENNVAEETNRVTDLLLARVLTAERNQALQNQLSNQLFSEIFENSNLFGGF